MTSAQADHFSTDIWTVLDLVNECVGATQTILIHQDGSKELWEKLERFMIYALRFQRLALVLRRLRNAHTFLPCWEEDTNGIILGFRNALIKAKSDLDEWERKLRHGEQGFGHNLRDGIKHMFRKADWMEQAESEMDLLLVVLRQHRNHLHKNIQLCAFYSTITVGPDLPTIRFVERALNRQNNRIPITHPHVLDTKVESVYGVEIVQVSDQSSPHNGCILEERSLFPRTLGSDTRRIARLLAVRLRNTDLERPFLALPICHGICHSRLLLEPPLKSVGSHRTLRSLLAERRSQPTYSLNSRLLFSIDLAKAVLILHSLEIVHKNIRPETILVLGTTTDEEKSTQLGRPCLIGFGSTHLAKTHQYLPPSYYGVSGRELGDNRTLHAMIYKHPNHWVSKRTEAHQMRDDIYGLGVCLLEIALWKSLFQWMDGLGDFINDQNTLRLCRPGDIHGDSTRQKWKKANQQLLIDLARRTVPATMGETYKDVVVACLTCWEKQRLREVITDGNIEDPYAQEMLEETEQSISFFQDVLTKLEGISL